jgi:phosphate transport system substrate-binding protein
MTAKRSSSVILTLATLIAVFCATGSWQARAQAYRDYMRVIGRPEVLVYAADVATALSKAGRRKFPQIEQSSAEGSRRTFCTKLRDSPDIMLIPTRGDRPPEKLCDNDEPLVSIPFGRQVFVLYTAPGGPRFTLSRDQIFRAMARELPRPGGAASGFQPNPNKRWRDISPDLPDVPIRLLGPPRRAVQWLTWEDLLMRPGCLMQPGVKELAQLDELAVEQHCLPRRTDQAIAYADGEAYIASPVIVPKGNELAINELRAMVLMPDAATQPVDGAMPDDATLNADHYPLARPILALFKVNRIDTIPNMRAFIYELVSPAAAGPDGYLSRHGMGLLPEEDLRRSAIKAQFARPVPAGEKAQ